MAFSKAPRILITDEESVKDNPGPGDYNPKGFEKRVKSATIVAETLKKELPTPTKPNYLKQKDTSDVAKKIHSSM